MNKDHKKNILLVDDSFENRYLLKLILEDFGFNILEANDGQEGLIMLKKNTVDLIVSDILMPVMDGYIFCKACKKEKQFKNIPFIFYTSTYTEKVDEELAIKIGASYFLRKPSDQEKLIIAIKSLINQEDANLEVANDDVEEEELVTEKEVLKFFSKRLISKLEQKNIDLKKEVLEKEKIQKQLEHENEVLELLSINTSLKKVFNRLLLNYEAVNPGSFGSLSILEDDGIHLKVIASPSMPKDFTEAIKRIEIGENVGSCGTSAFRKEPVIVSNISKDRLWKDYKHIAAKDGLVSCWSIPILSKKKQVLGTFAIYSKSINTPSLDNIRELNFAVNLAKIAIEKFKISNEIKKKDDYYHDLIDRANDAILSYTSSGEIEGFNKATYKNLGYTKKEFAKLQIHDIVVGEVFKNKEINNKLKKGLPVLVIKKVKHKSGEILEAEISAKKQDNNIIVAVARDITERQKNLKELQKEKEFSSSLLDTMKEGLYVIDTHSEIIRVNPSFCEMTGFTEQELMGVKRPYPFSPPELAKDNNKRYKLLTENKNKTDYENLYMRKNGERFPVQVIVSRIDDENGNKIANFATVQDITQRKATENKLKENIVRSNQRKNTIIELANLIGEDFTSSLKHIAFTSAKALDVALVTIWEYKNSGTQLYSKVHYNTLENSFETGSLTITQEEFPDYFNAFKHRTSLSIPDVLTNPITKAFSEKFFLINKMMSRIDIVIYGRQSNFGIISFECIRENRVFSAEEESFATSIANIVSLMVESNKRTLAENKIALTNQKLLEANKTLSKLQSQLKQENVYLRNELDLVFNFEEMVYGSVEFSNVLTEVETVAKTDATVLLLGESGTGKELLARAVHNISDRSNKPLIKVNCSAIPRELIESELFGHKKGSFTGAFSDKIGKFELAHEGTLFLDEIGELPLDMQPKILRFLQEGEIEVVGGTSIKKLDVRVIAATNRNLEEEIKKKQFREDLYFRLNVFPIKVPPLRERKDDIPLLVEHFVDKFNKAYNKNIKFIADDAMQKLKSYNWPGNIRELENLIERASILSTSETLVIPGFETTTQKSQSISNIDTSLDTAQRNHILQILNQCNWKISGAQSASELLKLKPSTLRDKMKKLGIEKPKIK